MYKEVEGDLIELALEGNFDVIGHGVNCWCTMGAGIAPQMAKAFRCDKFYLEEEDFRGDINKLGQIDYGYEAIKGPNVDEVVIVNAYTQYGFGRNHEDGSSSPLDYDALTLCMRKINHIFAGKKIGLPQIGAGLGGGDWERIKKIIQTELTSCDVTVVIYKPSIKDTITNSKLFKKTK